MVSIPLESGHIVIFSSRFRRKSESSFNPLRIGSYCNILITSDLAMVTVSIPLESGHIVIKKVVMIMCYLTVSIPLESGHIVIWLDG